MAPQPSLPFILRTHGPTSVLAVKASNLELELLAQSGSQQAQLVQVLNQWFTVADVHQHENRHWRFASSNATFLVAAGVLPGQQGNHAESLLQYAEELNKASQQVFLPNGQPLQLSFALHSEPTSNTAVLGKRLQFEVTGSVAVVAQYLIPYVQPGRIMATSAAVKALGSAGKQVWVPSGVLRICGNDYLTHDLPAWELSQQPAQASNCLSDRPVVPITWEPLTAAAAHAELCSGSSAALPSASAPIPISSSQLPSGPPSTASSPPISMVEVPSPRTVAAAKASCSGLAHDSGHPGQSLKSGGDPSASCRTSVVDGSCDSMGADLTFSLLWLSFMQPGLQAAYRKWLSQRTLLIDTAVLTVRLLSVLSFYHSPFGYGAPATITRPTSGPPFYLWLLLLVACVLPLWPATLTTRWYSRNRTWLLVTHCLLVTFCSSYLTMPWLFGHPVKGAPLAIMARLTGADSVLHNALLALPFQQHFLLQLTTFLMVLPAAPFVCQHILSPQVAPSLDNSVWGRPAHLPWPACTSSVLLIWCIGVALLLSLAVAWLSQLMYMLQFQSRQRALLEEHQSDWCSNSSRDVVSAGEAEAPNRPTAQTAST